MKKLDLIVTHYQESISVFNKFFWSLKMQRLIDWNDIRIILVQDGPIEGLTLKGTSEYWSNINQKFGVPCEFRGELHSENRGVSAARNTGLKASDAKWVLFCDCDDFFATPYALKDILNVLDTDDFDVLNGKFYAEFGCGKLSGIMEQLGKNIIVKIEHPSSMFIHCKVIRRKFLEEHDLWFPEDMPFAEDVVFNVKVNLRVPKGRTGDITATAPLYVWTYRKGSLSATPDVWEKDAYWNPVKHLKLLPEFREWSDYQTYLSMVAHSFYSYYLHPGRNAESDKMFYPLYLKYIDEFNAIPISIKAAVRKESSGYYQERAGKVSDDSSFLSWLKKIGNDAKNSSDILNKNL